MNVLLTTLANLISFLQQSFFPAFIFVLLNEFLILPALPQTGVIAELVSLDLLGKSVVALIIGLVLAYVLNNLNIPLTRFFQGYPWLQTWFGKWRIKRQRVQLDRLESKISGLTNQILSLQEERGHYAIDDPRRYELYQKEKELWFAITVYRQEREQHFPLDPTTLLPTRLGNTISAFEDYARIRYGIDTVTLWPRFVPILTQRNYTVHIEREKVVFDFLLNLSVLSIIFASEMAAVSLAFSEVLWLIGTGATLLLAYGLYRLSCTSAVNWGRVIRAAFDLYRYDLLSALHGRPPTDFSNERYLWEELSFLFRAGVTKRKEDEEEISRVLDYPRVQEEIRKPLDNTYGQREA